MGAPRDSTALHEETARRPAAGGGDRWLCRACRAPVTDAADAIRVMGRHEHHFSNPAARLFRVGCFRRAPGVMATGCATEVYTWFPGYAWRIALCARCGQQLGWRYEGAAAFYGLDLDSLVQEEAS